MSALDALTSIRGSIGVATWFAPRLVAALLGFRGPVTRELRYVCRIWGARNLALATATRTVPRSQRRAWLTANIAIDLIDIAGGIRFLRGGGGRLAAATALAPPAAAAALAFAARSGLPAAPGEPPRPGAGGER